MKTSYKNSFWKAGENNPYSKETLIHDTATGGKPEEYKGFTIYPRWDRFAMCYDIVKDGVCVSQYAGPNGARGAIDKLTEGHDAIEVKTLDDLPLPKMGSGGIECPNWDRSVSYRATAWAYLNREDGGDTVIYKGEKYRLQKKTEGRT